MAKNITFNKKAWDEIVRHVIKTEARPRMQRVADACNAELHEHPHHGPADGFKASDDGDEPLTKRDFSATVITATPPAMAHNAKHNTLVRNFHLAGGE